MYRFPSQLVQHNKQKLVSVFQLPHCSEGIPISSAHGKRRHIQIMRNARLKSASRRKIMCAFWANRVRQYYRCLPLMHARTTSRQTRYMCLPFGIALGKANHWSSYCRKIACWSLLHSFLLSINSVLGCLSRSQQCQYFNAIHQGSSTCIRHINQIRIRFFIGDGGSGGVGASVSPFLHLSDHPTPSASNPPRLCQLSWSSVIFHYGLTRGIPSSKCLT